MNTWLKTSEILWGAKSNGPRPRVWNQAQQLQDHKQEEEWQADDDAPVKGKRVAHDRAAESDHGNEHEVEDSSSQHVLTSDTGGISIHPSPSFFVEA